MNLDELVFDFSRHASDGDYDRDTWLAIARHAILRLSAALGRDLHIEEGQNECYGTGFSMFVRWQETGSDGWGFALRGTVGADVVGESLLIRAWIYPYLGKRRLSPFQGGDVLVFVYTNQQDGGAWELQGWENEEPGEADAFNAFNG